MGSFVFDVIFAAVVSVYTILLLAFYARWAWRQGSSASARKVLVRLKDVLFSGPGLLRDITDLDLRKQVLERVEEARLVHIERFLTMLSAVCFFIGLMACSQMLGGLTRIGHCWQSDVAFLVQSSVLAAWTYSSAIFTARGLRLCLLLQYLACVLHQFPWSPEGTRESVFVMAPFYICIVVIPAAFTLSFRTAIGAVAVSCSVQACSFALLPAAGLTVTVRRFAIYQAVAFLASSCVISIAQKHVVDSAYREEKAKVERSSRSAMMSLLSNVCDAVVELDSSWRLVDHVPELADLLLHGAGRSLQGVEMSHFLAGQSDRSVFAENVNNATPVSEATMFLARVKDSLGNRIRMRFLHISFLIFGNQRRHLIGLVESPDVKLTQQENVVIPTGTESSGDSHGQPPSLGSIPEFNPPEEPVEPEDSPLHRRLDQEMGAHIVESGSSSVTVGVAQTAQTAQPDSGLNMSGLLGLDSSRSDLSKEENALQVDLKISPGMPISYASTRFKAKYLCGANCANFAECLSDQDAGTLYEWVSGLASEIVDGRLPGHRYEEYGTLSIMPRSVPDETSPRRLQTRPGPRQVVVLFPAPAPRALQRGVGETIEDQLAKYVVSLRFGPRVEAADDARGTAAVSVRHSL